MVEVGTRADRPPTRMAGPAGQAWLPLLIRYQFACIVLTKKADDSVCNSTFFGCTVNLSAGGTVGLNSRAKWDVSSILYIRPAGRFAGDGQSRAGDQ